MRWYEAAASRTVGIVIQFGVSEPDTFCEEFFSLSLFGVIRTQIQKEKSATSSKNNIERAKTIVFGVKNMNNTLKTSTNNSKIAPKARNFF